MQRLGFVKFVHAVQWDGSAVYTLQAKRGENVVAEIEREGGMLTMWMCKQNKRLPNVPPVEVPVSNLVYGVRELEKPPEPTREGKR